MDEPVRRFFTHAAGTEEVPPAAVRLTMGGRIKVGRWLPFTADQRIDGRSFDWRARVGWGPITPLSVVDRYADGTGSTEGRLLGRIALFRNADRDTTRSAAGRAALESVAFSPGAVMPGRGVEWHADSDELIVGRFDLPPERPEVWVRLAPDGAVRTVSAMRWGNPDGDGFAYVPCGCEVHSERRFGAVVTPATITVAWWFGTARHTPFFKAEIRSLEGFREVE
jgi:hypothetical protein